jgi:hypothetical protein
MDAAATAGAPDGFPTTNTVLALGAVELQLTGDHIRFGWFEDAGSGSTVSWSTGGNPFEDLSQGVHELTAQAGAITVLGATADGGKIVAAWDTVS